MNAGGFGGLPAVIPAIPQVVGAISQVIGAISPVVCEIPPVVGEMPSRPKITKKTLKNTLLPLRMVR